MPFGGGVGVWEIVLLVVLALILFGAKKLPELGRSAGKGLREFKDSVTEYRKPIDEVVDAVPLEQVRTVAPFRNPRKALTKILTDEPKAAETKPADT
jgi:sec-independent protein translocase protein TatA